MCQKSSCVLDVSRKLPADPDLRIRNFLAVSARLDAADSTLLSSQMEQIKRANRMYTNDSIHLRTSLSIPVLLDCGGGVESLPDPSLDEEAAGNVRSDRKREDGGGTAEELSPEDFLKRLDGLIQQSKQAAVRGCRDAEERLVVPGAPSQSRNAGTPEPAGLIPALCFFPAGLRLWRRSAAGPRPPGGPCSGLRAHCRPPEVSS